MSNPGVCVGLEVQGMQVPVPQPLRAVRESLPLIWVVLTNRSQSVFPRKSDTSVAPLFSGSGSWIQGEREIKLPVPSNHQNYLSELWTPFKMTEGSWIIILCKNLTQFMLITRSLVLACFLNKSSLSLLKKGRLKNGASATVCLIQGCRIRP